MDISDKHLESDDHMENYNRREEKIEKLREYADLDGTEVGEVCHFICDALHYSDYISNENLVKELENEIDDKLSFFKETFDIVTFTETYEREYTRLEEK